MSLLDTIIGGPIGMGIDGWLGSTTADRPQDGVRRLADMSQEEAKNVFIVTLFSMMAKMAKADGRLSTEEVDLVNRMARSNIVMDAEDQKAAVVIFNIALSNSYSIYNYANQYRQLGASKLMCEMAYRLLFAVAFADEELHPEEDAILEQMPVHLGIDQSRYQIIRQQFRGRSVGVDESYNLLGCNPENSNEEITHAYSTLCREYHPDKATEKGLPIDFLRFAEQQMEQINAAYETVMARRRHQ